MPTRSCWKTVTGKIFAQHLAKGTSKNQGEEIGVIIGSDLLTQDATASTVAVPTWKPGSAGHRPRQDRIDRLSYIQITIP